MLPKRVYAKINLDNIQKNVKPIVDRMGDGVAVMGIVKADAYGHGAVEVSKALLEIGVKAFGVATIGEAVELRKNGIEAPILVLGQIFKEEFHTAVEYDIASAMFDIHCARDLSEIALEQGKKAKIYIKIDTGMGRIGFQPDDDGFERIKQVFNNGGDFLFFFHVRFSFREQILTRASRKCVRIPLLGDFSFRLYNILCCERII